MENIYDISMLSNEKIRFGVTDDKLLTNRTKEEYLADTYRINNDGFVEFELYYPNANEVTLATYPESKVNLVKKGDVFTGSFKASPGILGINISVDGNETLNPYLPIGYGSNKAINYIDVPDPDMDMSCDISEHGHIELRYIKSDISKRTERVVVYVPYGYGDDEKRKYPVLYLQHGHGENELVWLHQGKINFIMDRFIAEGKVKPCLIVMCNGMYYEESDVGIELKIMNTPKRIVEEVVPYIEKEYRVISDRNHRAIAGLSMGSLQSSMTAIMNPDIFAYVGVFSGFVNNFLTDEKEYMDKERLKTFAKSDCFLFRAIGDRDEYMQHFLEDDKILAENNIKCTRHIYKGQHEWKVWRYCFRDFIQLIFK